MTLNYIWLWGYSLDLLNVEYSFTAITPWVVELVWVLCRGQIDLFKNYSYSIGLIKKKKLHKMLI